jgi:hypothetical protein
LGMKIRQLHQTGSCHALFRERFRLRNRHFRISGSLSSVSRSLRGTKVNPLVGETQSGREQSAVNPILVEPNSSMAPSNRSTGKVKQPLADHKARTHVSHETVAGCEQTARSETIHGRTCKPQGTPINSGWYVEKHPAPRQVRPQKLVWNCSRRRGVDTQPRDGLTPH